MCMLVCVSSKKSIPEAWRWQLPQLVTAAVGEFKLTCNRHVPSVVAFCSLIPPSCIK